MLLDLDRLFFAPQEEAIPKPNNSCTWTLYTPSSTAAHISNRKMLENDTHQNQCLVRQGSPRIQVSICVYIVAFRSPSVHVYSRTARAANNIRSSDNGRPKFANVRRNRNLGRTFCPANFLLQQLPISVTNKVLLSYRLLFRMYLCVYVRPNFLFV